MEIRQQSILRFMHPKKDNLLLLANLLYKK